MRIEETLNGGYNGLYGEVVTHDCYKLRTLDFVPDIVFDIGANIGIFTRYAQSLWPDVRIIAVEPHPDNVRLFKFYSPITAYGNLLLIPTALGKGQIWHNKGARNGSGESYVSSGLGYDEAEMKTAYDAAEPSSLLPITIAELVTDPYSGFWEEGMKSVMKIDCEGGENSIWDDEKSMEALKKMDYICMETHFYALHGGKMYDEMKEKTLAALKSFEDTHYCTFKHPHFEARKK